MPRILGVDIPNDKPTHISLRYIYGIGPTLALRLCEQARVDPQRRAKELSDDEIAARLAAWRPPAPHYESGVMAKYAALVSSASEGAVTRP